MVKETAILLVQALIDFCIKRQSGLELSQHVGTPTSSSKAPQEHQKLG